MTKAVLQRGIVAVAMAVAMVTAGISTPASADPTGGTVAGHVLSATGMPLANVNVQLLTQFGSDFGSTSTDATGAYQFTDVPTGSYLEVVTFANDQMVYYPNTTDQFGAVPFTVSADATTTIDMTEGPIGNLVVKVLDANTGLPLGGACVYSQSGFNFSACSGADGKVTVIGIPADSYDFGVSGPSGNYLNGDATGVLVTGGQTTTKTVKLKTGATIHFNVVDATTGDPVDGSSLCVEMVLPYQHGDVGSPSCNGASDMIGIGPSTFKLFVVPTDGVHGAQWVGPTGGTGDPAGAESFKVTYNQQLNVTIRLDGEGSISGVIRDAATGDPESGVCPSATPPSGQYNNPFDGGCTFSYSAGQFELTGLGPYLWKVAFADYSRTDAWGWSGNAVDRNKATAVQVVAGQTVKVNARLKAAGSISGTVTGECNRCLAYALDANTGDYAAISTNVAADGTFTLTGFNTGDVWLYFATNGDTNYRYPTKVHVTAGQPITGISVVIPS